MSVGVTEFTDMLKRVYSQKNVDRLCYENQPFWSWLPKKQNFGGLNHPCPIQYGMPAGISRTFTTAQSNESSSQYKQFEITRVKNYGIMRLQTEVIEASMGSDSAWAPARLREVGSIFQKLSQDLAKDCVTNQGGHMCVGRSAAVNTTPTPDQVTVKLQSAGASVRNADDITQIEVGDYLVYSEGDGSATAHALADSGAVLKVLSVNREDAEFTAEVHSGTIASGVIDDSVTGGEDLYFFREGSFKNAVAGLDAYLPATAPTSGDDFFGVDRSADDRLSGWRYDASSYDLLSGIERGLARGRREQANPDTLWVSVNQFSRISLDMGSQIQRQKVKMGGNGYSSIVFHSHNKTIRILADHNIPDHVGYALERKTWLWRSMKASPRFIWQGNDKQVPVYNADEVEFRLGWYGNLFCFSPGKNGRILLPT